MNREHYAILAVARRQLGLDEETWRDMLEGISGVRSARQLTPEMFLAVMQHLEQSGFESTTEKRTRDPKAPPTPHQQQKLTELWAQLGWDQQRRMGFARRVCGAPWPQNRRDAGKVIEALKAMLQRGYTGERAGGDHA